MFQTKIQEFKTLAGTLVLITADAVVPAVPQSLNAGMSEMAGAVAAKLVNTAIDSFLAAWRAE